MTTNNTIWSCETAKGPPSLAGTFANASCFEMAFAQTMPGGYYQNMYSSYNSDNVPLSKSVSALGILPTVNSRSCDNCIKTLAATDPVLNSCIAIEPKLPNGAIIPMGSYNSQKCQAAMSFALNKCAIRCAGCV